MKRILSFIAVIILAVSVTGCSADKKANLPTDNGGSRVFVDSTGREITLPDNITKIAVTGPLSQMIIYSFAPELLACWCSRWSEQAQKYIPEEYWKLPVLGQLYGSKGEMNPEELIALGPDVVLDIGEGKKSMKEDMEELSTQTGIPFVHIEATMQTMGDAYRKLGELTGLEDRAGEYAAYCEEIYGRIADIMNQVGENQKIRALYCLGDAGCNVIAKGSYQSEIIDLITDNVAVVENPSAKGTGNEADMEQILNWNPDFIIFAPDSIYDEVADDPAWQQISAIKNGNYVKVPLGPHNWLGFPPSVQRYPGMMWLAKVLYPDKCTFDIAEEVKRYYRMFYHVDLSDADYELLTEDAFLH